MLAGVLYYPQVSRENGIQNPFPRGVTVQVRPRAPYKDKASTIHLVGALLFLGFLAINCSDIEWNGYKLAMHWVSVNALMA